mgnify:CR=1 FL=1
MNLFLWLPLVATFVGTIVVGFFWNIYLLHREEYVMNEQMAFLASMIDLAKEGRKGKGAPRVLRDICRGAADAAPPADLIRMAQFLFDLRAEAARRDIEKN